MRDLNVIVRRGLFAPEMKIRQGPGTLSAEIEDGDVFLLHDFTGGCSVRIDDAAPHDLSPAETLLHEGRGRIEIRLAEAGRVVVIRITQR